MSVFLCLALLAATPQDPAVFPSGTQLVTVDVVVMDASGNPVPGLTQADFTVYENGERREIQSFESVRVPAGTGEPVEAARPRASTNLERPAARAFVIVFDELHLTPPTAERAKDAIRSFLREGPRPGDRITLVPTGGGHWWTDTMPSGRDDLLAVLDSMQGKARFGTGADVITPWEALKISVHRDQAVGNAVQRRWIENGALPDCMGGGETGGACTWPEGMREGHPTVMMAASEVYNEGVTRRRATLRLLDSVLESLAAMRGYRSVFLVSEGFVHETTLTELHDVIDAARRANTAVHFVDARGLMPADGMIVDQGRLAQATASISGKPTTNDVGQNLDQARLVAEGSDAVAADTGGLSFKNTNDIKGAFDQLARETGTYYLVGYAPPELKRDGKFRRIEVKVSRPGVKVRARRGYVVPREADLRERQPGQEEAVLQAMAAPPVDASTLPLRLAAYTLGDAEAGQVRVVLAAEADPAVFAWDEKEGRFEDALDTTVNLLPRAGAEVKSESRLLELSLPASARAQLEQGWLPIVREYQLAPGVYQARLAVRERNAGRAGSVRHAFEVPAPGGFRITTPILSDVLQPVGATGAGKPAPLARRAFPRGARVFCEFEVLNASKDAEGKPQVAAGHVLRRAGDGTVISSMEPAPLAPDAGGRLSRTLAISLRTAQPGAHELTLTARDTVTGRTVESVEVFEVTTAMVAQAAPPAPAVAPPPGVPDLPLVEPRAGLELAQRQARAGGPQARRWAVAAALFLDRLGSGPEALRQLHGLLKQAPGDPDVLLALGAIEEAQVEAMAARGVGPRPAGSEQLPRFQVEAARDRILREIEGRYRAALGARSDDPELRLRLGRVLQRRGQPEAVSHLEQVAAGPAAEPRSLARLFLGEWHETKGRAEAAATAYRSAVDAAPHGRSARIALAQALWRSGDRAGARDAVETGLASAGGLDPFLTYQHPALRLGSSLVIALQKEGAR